MTARYQPGDRVRVVAYPVTSEPVVGLAGVCADRGDDDLITIRLSDGRCWLFRDDEIESESASIERLYRISLDAIDNDACMLAIQAKCAVGDLVSRINVMRNQGPACAEFATQLERTAAQLAWDACVVIEKNRKEAT